MLRRTNVHSISNNVTRPEHSPSQLHIAGGIWRCDESASNSLLKSSAGFSQAPLHVVFCLFVLNSLWMARAREWRLTGYACYRWCSNSQ
ncbi:conserved protein of unknown function [Pseudomonas marincola]|uniref:Uncharacterized protein n=1 Tax=Pseudomonas marincola TaxID=437900 RepID=A0A653E6T1_9PSED|nr:conserved protein of unknown function [Pseudomonas marincola]